VFSRCPGALVMADDFEVPHDPGYGYDDYGPGRALTRDYLTPVLETYRLSEFYPSTPSAHESGGRRGCVVLARADVHGNVLASLPLLRRVP
jgi:hypothetical protein